MYAQIPAFAGITAIRTRFKPALMAIHCAIKHEFHCKWQPPLCALIL